MTIVEALKYAICVDSVLIIIFVLLQNRNGGLGTVFGGTTGGEFYRSKRGLEAFLYNGTIILGIIFAILAIGIAILNV